MKANMLFVALALVSGQAAMAGSLASPVLEPVVDAPDYALSSTANSVDWSGFYAGVHGSKASGKYKAGSTGSSVKGDGNAIGAHAGYLYDLGSAVVGGEVSVDKLSSLKADGSNAKFDGMSYSAKGIVGYNAGRLLPYATAGLERVSIDKAGVGGKDLSENGFVYGLGVKYMATDNMQIGAEVLRHNFDKLGGIKGSSLDGTTLGANVSFKF